MKYVVNEIFYSLQGEGVRAGTPNVFVRFAGCNLKCDEKASDVSPGGFMCDTEFASGRPYTHDTLFAGIMEQLPVTGNAGVIFTGGEPALQLHEELVGALNGRGIVTCIETNGSINVDELGLRWITVSPKVAEHAIKQRRAHEVKYVRSNGQGIPQTVVHADHYLISPAFQTWGVAQRDLEWCIGLVKQNPRWRLSVQQHKGWKVR